MRHDNLKQFNYIKSLDKDMFNAYNKYRSESIEVKAKAVEIYFYLQERKSLSKFGKILVKENLSIADHSFNTSCCKVLFTSREGFGGFPTFIKYKQYIKEFNKHYTI